MQVELQNAERIRLLRHIKEDIRQAEQNPKATIHTMEQLYGLRDKLSLRKVIPL